MLIPLFTILGEHFQPVIDGLQSESYYAVRYTLLSI